MEKHIQSFTDLDTWKEGHTLVLMIYKMTKQFPSDERFGLVNQSRRAAISVTSNIAEGFGRTTAKDKKRFYMHAKTSLAELQNQMIASKDLEYISEADFESCMGQSVKVDSLVAGLAKSSKDKE